MPSPDALISDCDGVLVDSEVIAERVMYEALSAHAPLEELQRLLEGTFGLTSRDILVASRSTSACASPTASTARCASAAGRWSPRSNPFPAHARRCWPWICRRGGLQQPPPQPGALAGARRAQRTDRRTPGQRRYGRPAQARTRRLPARRQPAGVAPSVAWWWKTAAPAPRAAAADAVIGFVGAGHIPAGHAEVLRELGAIAIVEHMRELPETVARLRRESRVALGTP